MCFFCFCFCRRTWLTFQSPLQPRLEVLPLQSTPFSPGFKANGKDSQQRVRSTASSHSLACSSVTESKAESRFFPEPAATPLRARAAKDGEARSPTEAQRGAAAAPRGPPGSLETRASPKALPPTSPARQGASSAEPRMQQLETLTCPKWSTGQIPRSRLDPLPPCVPLARRRWAQKWPRRDTWSQCRGLSAPRWPWPAAQGEGRVLCFPRASNSPGPSGTRHPRGPARGPFIPPRAPGTPRKQLSGGVQGFPSGFRFDPVSRFQVSRIPILYSAFF